MGTTSPRKLAFALALTLGSLTPTNALAVPPRPNEPTTTDGAEARPTPAPEVEPPPPAPAPAVPRPEPTAVPPPAREAAPPVANPSPRPMPVLAAPESETAELRAATQARLQKLPKPDDKAASSASKVLREVLEDRLRWLDEWDKATLALQELQRPQTSPEEQAAEWKADLGRTLAALAAGAKDPNSLLPEGFRKLPAEIPPALRASLIEAIASAEAEWKETSARCEQARVESGAGRDDGLAELRSGRDKLFQRLTVLKARTAERERAVAEAKGIEARELARERLVSAQWETRVETERLKWREAMIALRGKAGELAALNLQLLEAQVQLRDKVTKRLKELYANLAAREQRDLRKAADRAKSQADHEDNPLQRYRAKRTAELLELEARVVSNENALATNPSPSLDEQRELADRAATDFSNIKHLLDDGRVSQLDALRLNNDFRRIAAERARIERVELAACTNRLTSAENSLSAVELELVHDARDDRLELDSVLERLPRSLHPSALSLFEELERKHLSLLNRRRAALEKLATRAEQTHEQVRRRMELLDEHYGFIRTHIFWVRDEEPITATTLARANRDFLRLARAVLRLVSESGEPSLWGRWSLEFGLAGVGLAALPWPLLYFRRRIAAPPRPGHAPQSP